MNRYIIEITETADCGVLVRTRDEGEHGHRARLVGEKLLRLLPLHMARAVHPAPRTQQ